MTTCSHCTRPASPGRAQCEACLASFAASRARRKARSSAALAARIGTEPPSGVAFLPVLQARRRGGRLRDADFDLLGYALVDADRLAAVKALGRWVLGSAGYPECGSAAAAAVGGGRKLRLHAFIAGTGGGAGRAFAWVPDHLNDDVTDNRRDNLRITQPGSNSRRARMRSDNTSGFPGVTRHVGGRWTARVLGQYLGLHDTPEAAYLSYYQWIIANRAAHEVHADLHAHADRARQTLGRTGTPSVA